MFGDFPQLCYQHSMAPGVPQTSNDFATKAESVMLVANIHDQQIRNFEEFPSKRCLRKKSMELIGVVLVDDRAVGKTTASTDSRNVVLGTICVESTGLNLEELRRLMCTELPCLPASFNFLTKDGWPIHKPQEHKINSSHVIRDDNCICIKKEYEKSKIGVITSKGDYIGFIFTDLNINIKQLRESIEQQLKLSQQMRPDYRFVEKNGWPVMPKQEASLSLLDIMLGHAVCIQNCDNRITTPTDPLRPTSLIYTPPNAIAESSSQLPSPQDSTGDPESVKRKKSIKFKPESQFSIKLRKDSDKRPRTSNKNSLVRPILISYVRAEAAQYALDLKQELVSQGFNVYLDVHEIKTGSDWQDALNHAVTHCYLFVPLITPMYGKTQWTNREVKLADVLGKMIIPVNFMDHWPPPCLAIQFASTQYIPWKLQESDHVKGENEKAMDPRHWDRACVKRVSRQIADCFKDYYRMIKRTPSSKEVTREVSSSRALLSQKPEEYYSLSKDDYSLDGKQTIVISAHPRQRYLAQDLKTMFERICHEVWCSVDLLDLGNFGSEDITNADLPNTPRNLPTIQEGDVFFNQTVFNSGDKKFTEQEAYGRRPLSRLMSQFSDISQPSTLSREKLDQLHTFQQKVDQAAVIIVLVSAAYTKSAFSQQQVFYCEHRKRVVLVNCDSATIPKWFRLLMGNDMIMKKDNLEFESILKTRVKRALNPSSSETPKDATAEAKMNCLVNFLKKNLPLHDLCVYVAGSSKLQSERSEEICKAIGKELAKVERVSLVTGGFYGAADITAKTFFECRGRVKESVLHILPERDSEDYTAKAKQNMADGSFEPIPYGHTVYLGDSVKERETVVARLLDTCLVIEGGPGVVHEVEEFIWNDHFVIPIMSTGGAASGCFGVPVKIFETPPGVDESDWSILSEKNASPEMVAKSVVNIMVSLKKSLSSPTNTLQKSNAILKRKSKRKLRSRRQWEGEGAEDTAPSTSTPHVQLSSMKEMYELRRAFEMSQCSSQDTLSVTKKKSSWWRRFLKVFKRKN